MLKEFEVVFPVEVREVDSHGLAQVHKFVVKVAAHSANEAAMMVGQALGQALKTSSSAPGPLGAGWVSTKAAG